LSIIDNNKEIIVFYWGSRTLSKPASLYYFIINEKRCFVLLFYNKRVSLTANSRDNGDMSNKKEVVSGNL